MHCWKSVEEAILRYNGKIVRKIGIEGWCRKMTEYSGHMDAADWSKITITHAPGYGWLKKWVVCSCDP